jgi:SpoIIAA-like
MIELLPETHGTVIAVKMAGTVTEAEMEEYAKQADRVYEQERVERLLLDWSELDGWAPGARSTGTWFGMHHRALVSRVAVVADDKWADETLRIVDIFRASSVRRFPPVEREKAFAWLCEA